MMAGLIGSSMRCTGNSSSREATRSRPEIKDDKECRRALAVIVGKGEWAHWSLIVTFEGRKESPADSGRHVVCELTAISPAGKRWQENHYVIHDIEDREVYMETEGVRADLFDALGEPESPCFHKPFPNRLQAFVYKLEISPAELFDFCDKHEMNNTPYNLINNNCQKWVKMLLKRMFEENKTCTNLESEWPLFEHPFQLDNLFGKRFSLCPMPQPRFPDATINEWRHFKHIQGEDYTLPKCAWLTDTSVGYVRVCDTYSDWTRFELTKEGQRIQERKEDNSARAMQALQDGLAKVHPNLVYLVNPLPLLARMARR